MDFVSEINKRMKTTDGACVILDLCYHRLKSNIEEDVEHIQSGHVPEDLKARQELLAELENSLRVCTEWGESCQAHWEEKMERDISRYERMK